MVQPSDRRLVTEAALSVRESFYLSRSNHNGTQSLDTTIDSATRLALTTAERTKLGAIAAGATLNSTDAQLKDRANHTGVQASSTVSDFQEAVEDVVAAMLGRSTQTGITWAYNDTTNSLSATVTGGGGGTFDAEAARDSIGAALIGTGVISVVANDAGDTIVISSTATANSTDAVLLSRVNHTGTQSMDTVLDSATRLAMTTAERSKLTGIATGATANSTDAVLKARANHTGTQPISTIEGLDLELADKLEIIGISDIPGGFVMFAAYNAVRPTTRTDIVVIFVGGTDATPPQNGIAGVDLWLKDYTG